MLQDQDLLAIQEVRSKVEKAYQASIKFRSYPQDRIDAIVERMAEAAQGRAAELAEMAVKETGYGNAADKRIKNLLAADLLPRSLREMKTVGVLREIPEQRVVEIGVPVGVVAAILPTTNPTSTAIYKVIIGVKAGNAVVLSPHPRARQCTCATADVLARAAEEAGAPEGVIQCISNPTLEATNALMRHPRTAMILSTGGSGIVKQAYSSGKPALGVGPGNVPVLIDESANIAAAVAAVVEGKTFDYGTVCSSEQAIVAVEKLREPIVAALRGDNAHFCTPEQQEKLARALLTPSLGVNPAFVGQAPGVIARMVGFEVPADTRLLVVQLDGIGKEHPLSAEKLSPVLALHFVKDFGAALDACEAILRFGGLGHTCVIHANDEKRVHEFAARMPAFRVLVNTPAPQGSTGITTGVQPSMTLGCGAIAGNSTGDNIGPQHLMNVKRIAYGWRKPEEAFTSASAVKSRPAATIDRGKVVAAVERYLAGRGVATATPPPIGDVAALVDQFLEARRPAAAPQPAAAGPSVAPSPEPTPKPVPQPPTSEIAEFVCENDVRLAIQQSRKIFVGPKTIITPAARDLAAQHDTIVVAKR